MSLTFDVYRVDMSIKNMKTLASLKICFHGMMKEYQNFNGAVLALTVKIRKSQDFLAPISGSPGIKFFHSLSEIQTLYS